MNERKFYTSQLDVDDLGKQVTFYYKGSHPTPVKRTGTLIYVNLEKGYITVENEIEWTTRYKSFRIDLIDLGNESILIE